jgi:hypothetical protein
MANVITGNPLVLDTVGATSKITTPVSINAIIFMATTAADECKIHDSNSNRVIFDVTANANNQTIVFTPSEPIVCSQGIILTTLTHGQALIYI